MFLEGGGGGVWLGDLINWKVVAVGVVFSVGAVRFSWQHGDSCGPASVPSPGLLRQGSRCMQG